MNNTTAFSIRTPDDWHVHLRDGQMLRNVAPFTRPFGRILVMPNLYPDPIINSIGAQKYMEKIQTIFDELKIRCQPVPTIQLRENTPNGILVDASILGVRVVKVYPRGQTTNSNQGIVDYEACYSNFRTMEACDMVLSLHGETPVLDTYFLDKEEKFIPILSGIINSFPKLKVVLEHVSSQKMIEFIKQAPDNIAGTITAHHLKLTTNDILGAKLHPHNFCKPEAKRYEDRDALVEAAVSGNPKFFFGSDSAPHLQENKECADGCAGIFTAPVALPVLAQVFEDNKALDMLEAFTSMNGCTFYGYPVNDSIITLVKEPWTVPNTIGGVVPFYAGKKLSWSVR